MTQNQYLGTDLAPVITASPGDLNDEIVKALENVAGTLPADRLGRLAKLIVDRSPHVVSLNEAFAFSCSNMDPVHTPATEGCGNQRIKGAFVDFLATSEANLAGKYVTKARVRNFAAAEIPFEIDGYWAFLTVMDRDAILVRQDLAPFAAPVPLAANPACRPSLEGCNYIAVPTVTTSLGDITVERGYAAIDLLLAGQPYRIFATHLEQRELVPGNVESRVLQRLQAAELVQVADGFPALPGTRKLIVGDINSGPSDPLVALPTPIGPLPPPYFIFTGPAPGGAYTDAWTLRPGTATSNGAPLVGFSCCQDEYLSNHKSMLYERIDMIFSLKPPKKVFDARLLGDTVASKTSPPGLGLWPSDHASVAARLQY
ncbi:MAG: hypothetical protein FIB04_03385 [Gammaproteobacteria bacterium]|nr:hypothetical protein [Gammaproteobacteria bacterium]